MKVPIPIALGAILLVVLAPPVLSADPPHNAIRSIECVNCHTPHAAPGGTLNSIAGNANLCQSCHMPGGPALPLNDADQALPGPGLPGGTPASGNSHRWDSGTAGHVEPAATNTSTGGVASGGVFTGRFAKTYTITITAAGNAGSAIFSWTDTQGGSGSGFVSGVGVPLNEGVSVSFTNGTGSPSFLLNDEWRVYVRTDINAPTHPEMVLRLDDGTIMCSTCHNQHSQLLQPFDPFAPPYSGPGTGWLRHYQRADNDTNQMCVECHSARDVPHSSLGSHPVGIGVPGGGDFKAPAILLLDAAGDVACLSCHRAHQAATTDGTVARLANTNTLCTDCHTLADTATPASHLDAAGGLLWPGGQYGSSFPAITDTGKRGFCTNCHQPHGWPDDASPAQDYPLLLVDREEDLCFTCHDNGPAAENIMAEIGKTSAHPLGLASGTHTAGEAAVVNSPNRHVECVDCHNSHQATASSGRPGPTTSPRSASGPLAEVRGVNTSGASVASASYEYEVCFRCHADSSGKPAAPTTRQFVHTNVRLEFNGGYDSFHTVAAGTSGGNPDVPSLIGGYTTNSVLACTSCHNNDDLGSGPPNGPHGSDRPTLLERRYETNDPQSYSSAKYALCFKCHSATNILNDNSFDDHNKHIDGEDTPCNTCHDPHASSGQKMLINFNRNVVSPSGGRLEFISPQDSGDGNGYCYLVCHGKDHDPKDYQPNY